MERIQGNKKVFNARTTSTGLVKSGPWDQPRNTACFHSQEAFKVGSNMSNHQEIIHLFQCAHDKPGDLMLANDPMLMAKPEEYVANLMQ